MGEALADYSADVVIAGGGLAGLVAAYDLIGYGKSVIVLDKDKQAKLGGLARESFGGVHLIGTPHQKRAGIRDTPELALRDWESYAAFGAGDDWPRRWARFYCENSLELIFHYLSEKRIEFLPVVNWPERGLFAPGNSVPRWHITWGTGAEIIARILAALERHPRRQSLDIRFDHEVADIELQNGRAVAVTGRDLAGGRTFRATGEHVIVATGGICGGDLGKLRRHWFSGWGAPPQKILNGAHIYADGLLQDKIAALGGNVTHLDKQWHYAAGVHHPAKRKPDDGLSLVPPRSALWLNAHGERIGPVPLVGYTDTRFLVESIVKQPGQYSWQLLNWKIAIKELAVSGSEHMTAFVNKSKVLLLKHLLFGNKELIERLLRECPDDFAVASSLPELVTEMNKRSLYGLGVDGDKVAAAVRDYDGQIDRGPAYYNDEQLRRIANFRTYRGDRLRVCKFQKIDDPKARPLIAIREFILSRKSLGGIQTDLSCRVLKPDGATIPGLYAVGEAAGFGGGGIHGQGSLEGTFLGACVLTGRVAGKFIAQGA
jgi:predicted oxidoreductase